MKPTLLILAAGMGSRYGGLKQVDGMGPTGEAIIDYSIFDALEAGFGKVVFVIRRDIEDEFKARVGNKFLGKIKVEYAFQELDTALDWLEKKPERSKPWGTAHALLAAKKLIREPFAAINADDFYGKSAFAALAKFLKKDCSPRKMAMVGYELSKTLSENGTVSRGVCSMDEKGHLAEVVEHTKIGIDEADGSIFNLENDGSKKMLAPATTVSMNFWGFDPSVFEVIERLWRPFVLENLDNPKAEFFIPLIATHLIASGEAAFEVLPCDAQWFGVTYTADKPIVQNALADFVEKGVYRSPLFG